MTQYYLLIKPRYMFDACLYNDYCTKNDVCDKETLEYYIKRNESRRELIRELIGTEIVHTPQIRCEWATATNADRVFSICSLTVFYDDNADISPKERLSYLRYIGEALLPWVESVDLIANYDN